MAIPKVKVTYSLSEQTAKKLGEIARAWNTSKSEALSRLIDASPQPTREDEIARKLAALDAYVASVSSRLTPEQIDQWERDTDDMHKNFGFRVDGGRDAG